MIESDSGIEVHICHHCDYAIRDEIPLTVTHDDWRPVTLDDGPNVFTWHSACAADLDKERADALRRQPKTDMRDTVTIYSSFLLDSINGLSFGGEGKHLTVEKTFICGGRPHGWTRRQVARLTIVGPYATDNPPFEQVPIATVDILAEDIPALIAALQAAIDHATEGTTS